jgi:hypothetical protein
MDVSTGSSSRQRPSWLPPQDSLDAVGAGRWWDAIAVDGRHGSQVVDVLKKTTGGRPGPVLCDPLGPEPRTYFLVPVGSAARWNVPGTLAFGECCYIAVPGSLDGDSIGVHWVVPPSSRGPALVRLRLLREALAQVLGSGA